MKKNYILFIMIVLSSIWSFGQSWNLQNSNIKNPINGISCGSSTNAIAVAQGYTTSTNDGNSWTARSFSITTTNYPQGVFCIDANNAYAVGGLNQSEIVKTTNNGQSWTTMSVPVSGKSITNLHFVNSTTGYAFGSGVALKYNGSTWSSITLPENGFFDGCYFTDINTGFVVGTYDQTNYNPIVYKTTNGGSSWSSVKISGFLGKAKSIAFSKTYPNIGYAVGWYQKTSGGSLYGLILKTTNGGTTWTGLAWDATSQLYAVAFSDATTVYAVGTGGTIIKNIVTNTANGNTASDNWQTQTSPTTQNLNSLCFADVSTGWAAGDNGVIVKYGIPNQSLSTCETTCLLRLKTPNDNATNMPTSTHIVWQAVPNATSYSIELADNNGNRLTTFSYPNANDLVIATVTAPTSEYLSLSGLAYNTTYKVKITAKQNNTIIACNTISFTTRTEFVSTGAAYESNYEGVTKCWGEPLAHFYNTIAKFNGAQSWQNNQTFCTPKSTYRICTANQCTDYARRFYQDFWDINLANAGIYGQSVASGYGTAVDNNTNSGLIYIPNNWNNPPKIGDIIVYSFSHVSIVKGVASNSIDIIQQNSYPVTKTHSVSNNRVSGQISGWVRPAPIDISYNTTNRILSFTTQITGASFDMYLQQLSGTCYEPVNNYNPYRIPENTGTTINLNAGSYRIKISSNLANSIGTVKSDFYYFTLNTNTTITLPANGNIAFATNVLSAKKSTNSLPTIASNVKISQRKNGVWYFKGYSSENGKLFAEFVPSLSIGDTIKAEGTGYVSKEIIITETMVVTGSISITLNESVTNDIVNPSVVIINNSPVFTSNTVNLKVKAENHIKYIVSYPSENDIETNQQEHLASDSLIAITLQEGYNNFMFTYINSNDTIALSKSFYYKPVVDNSNSYTISIINGKDAKFYVNGIYTKTLASNSESTILPIGTNRLVFEKTGYLTIAENVNNSGNIVLNFVKNVTSIDEIEFSSIALISPNPTTGLFNIQIQDNNAQNITCNIYDLSGKLVISKTGIKSNKFEIDLSNCKSGVYIVNLILDNKYYAHKMIKK